MTYFGAMIGDTFMHTVVSRMAGKVQIIDKAKLLLVEMHIIICIKHLYKFIKINVN